MAGKLHQMVLITQVRLVMEEADKGRYVTLQFGSETKDGIGLVKQMKVSLS